jgi:hypothetical protein
MGTGATKNTFAPFLIYLNAAIWFGLAVLIALDLHPAIPEGPLYRWGMSILALVAGSLLIVLYRYSIRSRLAYFLLLGLLALIAFLTLTDEFGLADLAVLISHLLAAVFLILNREDHLIRKVE